jgi:hypothetical protein
MLKRCAAGRPSWVAPQEMYERIEWTLYHFTEYDIHISDQSHPKTQKKLRFRERKTKLAPYHGETTSLYTLQPIEIHTQPLFTNGRSELHLHECGSLHNLTCEHNSFTKSGMTDLHPSLER